MMFTWLCHTGNINQVNIGVHVNMLVVCSIFLLLLDASKISHAGPLSLYVYYVYVFLYFVLSAHF